MRCKQCRNRPCSCNCGPPKGCNCGPKPCYYPPGCFPCPPLFDPCTSNPQTAINFVNAFGLRDNMGIQNLLAPASTLIYNGYHLMSGGNPVIPYAGTFVNGTSTIGTNGTINDFVNRFFTYGTNISFTAPDIITLSPNCSVVMLRNTINYTPRNANGTIIGSPEILPTVFLFIFNSIGQIQNVEIYTDTSELANFYRVNL